MKILLTGVAGFIGSATAKKLLDRGDHVIGLDNLNNYYDVGLKQTRLRQLEDRPNFKFFRADVSDRREMQGLFKDPSYDCVIHLAAQAGVRYSLENPHAFIDSNVVGFMNVLECCRRGQVKHLVYASSSSVYGGNTAVPFSEHHSVDHPVSLYAATKKANELMAHTYSHLYRLPTTGLRFFTVYGPWGRPDMAYFLFTKAIIEQREINVYNYGDMQRDFTYIEDIVEGIVRVADRPATPAPTYDSSNPDPSVSSSPYRVFNIGNQQPVPLLEFIEAIETAVGAKARKRLLPMQPGDVPSTIADVEALTRWTGFRPTTDVRQGVARFVEWYRHYYGV